MLDDVLITKLRKVQAEQIKTSEKNVSFSQIVNEQLKKSFK